MSSGQEKTEVTQQKNISEQTSDKSCDNVCDIELSEQVVNSTWCGLLAAFTLLIDARLNLFLKIILFLKNNAMSILHSGLHSVREEECRIVDLNNFYFDLYLIIY